MILFRVPKTRDRKEDQQYPDDQTAEVRQLEVPDAKEPPPEITADVEQAYDTENDP